MAKKKPVEPQIPVAPEAPPKSPARRLVIALVAVSVLSLFFFFLALHASGALDGPEEKVYQKLAKGDFTKALFKSLHHPKFSEKLSVDEAVDVIQLRKDILVTANTGEENKAKYDREMRARNKQIDELNSEVGALKTRVKTMEEATAVLTGGSIPAPAAVVTTSLAGSAPSMAAAAIVSPAGRALSRALAAKDYRKGSKIIDAMPTEQAVDILNALADPADVVEIVVLLKDKKAGEIIAALEPARGAEMIKMILDRRGGA